MAQIVKKESALEKQYQAAVKKSRLKLVLAGVCGVAAVVGIVAMLPWLSVAGVVGAGAFLALTAMDGQGNDVLRTGLAGENATADLIRQLPDAYRGFQNVVVTYEGKESEMDMVVAGPGGVFIIETKNHNGNIVGTFEDRQWRQHKVGRGGGAYEKEFYSPVKQVGTHVYRLAHFLRDRGVNVHVDAMVFFTNPAATVQVYGTPGNIPVLAGQAGATILCRQIVGGRQNLPQQTVRRIWALLEQCV